MQRPVHVVRVKTIRYTAGASASSAFIIVNKHFNFLMWCQNYSLPWYLMYTFASCFAFSPPHLNYCFYLLLVSRYPVYT